MYRYSYREAGNGREVPCTRTDRRAVMICSYSSPANSVSPCVFHPRRRGGRSLPSLVCHPSQVPIPHQQRAHGSGRAAGARVAWQWTVDGWPGWISVGLDLVCLLSQAQKRQRPAIAISPLFGRTLGVSQQRERVSCREACLAFHHLHLLAARPPLITPVQWSVESSATSICLTSLSPLQRPRSSVSQTSPGPSSVLTTSPSSQPRPCLPPWS
jgi:hypothetical protein